STRWRSSPCAAAASSASRCRAPEQRPLRSSSPVRLHSRARTRRRLVEAIGMAVTQEALYRKIDLELSWSERDLPERERTKHVHRLHPYLGKFVPQLVETLLRRYVPVGGRVLDPFAGSGTTLVQAL